MITSEQVKKALRQAGPGTPQELEVRLGIGNYKDRQKLRLILRDLKKSGGIYTDRELRCCLVDDPERRGGVQAKLWEFMTLRYTKAQPWSVAEAVKKAGCCRDYAKRYVRWLAQEGYLEAVGRQGNAILYRVRPGREKESAPAWNRRGEKRKRSKGMAGGDARPTEMDPLAEFRAGMQKFIDAAREALGVAAGHCQEAQEIVEEMAGFLGMPDGKHGEDGSDIL